MSDNSLQKKIQPDAQQLFELLQARMPFGKYAGRRLIDIPEEYLIWLKRTYPVLTEGEFVPLYADETVLAYARRLDDRIAVLMLNRGQSREIAFELPDSMGIESADLRGVHGPLTNLAIRQRSVQVRLETECTCLLINE